MKTVTWELPRILIVDDIPENLEIAGRILEDNDYAVHIADSGETALKILDRVDFDLILLDIMLPGMDGFETCQRIKADERHRRTPIIYLTAKVDIESVNRGFGCGAADYIRKPFNALEFLSRIKTHIDLKMTIKQLEDITTIDFLTRLSNRSDMLDKITYETYRYERNRNPFALILCRIKDYDGLERNLSEECRNQILYGLSKIIKNNIRKSDLPSRWQSDAFMILFPDTGSETAKIIAKKLDHRIRETIFDCPDGPVRIEMGYGFAIYEPQLSVDELVQEASRLQE